MCLETRMSGFIKINIFPAFLTCLCWLSLFTTIYEHALLVMFAAQPTQNLMQQCCYITLNCSICSQKISIIHYNM